MRRALAVLVAAVVVVACAGNEEDEGADRPAREPSGPTVDWNNVGTPMLARPDRALKDQAVVFADGRWVLLASSFTEPPLRTTVAVFTSPDLVTWTEQPSEGWPQSERRDDGLVLGGSFVGPSPDLTRSLDGTWVATYQAADASGVPRPWWRTSTDLEEWSPPQALAAEVRPGTRVIDAALAWADGFVVMAFKHDQQFGLAVSEDGLDGPWRELPAPVLFDAAGAPLAETIENYQFVRVDSAWHLLGTTIPAVHRPRLFGLDGDPSQPEGWTRWQQVRDLDVPAAAFNTGPGEPGLGHERANSAYLVADGDRWYLFFAGSTEVERFGRRGQSAIGVARSDDLVRFELPPGPSG